MIIPLVSQKGGVGKSALARLLAVEYANAGWSVKIADLDTMQATATKWKVRRDRAKLTPEIPVEKFATVERALREADRYDLLIIDGPAHAEKGGKLMASKGDLVLMPTCYGLDDLEAQVEAAYELEAEGIDPKRIWFVFSRTSGSENEEQTARDYLQRAKINVFAETLPELPCIRQGHNGGKAASEVSFPGIREKAVTLALSIAHQVDLLKQASKEPATGNEAKEAAA